MGRPSNIRREGRKSFIPGESPGNICPYKDQSYREDWMTGWHQAASEYDREMEDQEEQINKIRELENHCPWNSAGDCDSTGRPCDMENDCAVYYFIQNMNDF